MQCPSIERPAQRCNGALLQIARSGSGHTPAPVPRVLNGGIRKFSQRDADISSEAVP
jgi:hypothetical protein